MDDREDMRRSEAGSARRDQDLPEQDTAGLDNGSFVAACALSGSLACFGAVEIGYFVDVFRFGGIPALSALLAFSGGLALAYLAARFLPQSQIGSPARGVVASLLIASLVLACAGVYLGARTPDVGEPFSLVFVLACSFCNGLLICLGLLYCYSRLRDWGRRQTQGILTATLLGASLVFIILYWLVEPARTVAFSLLPLLGFVVLAISSTVGKLSPSGMSESRGSQADTHMSESRGSQADTHMSESRGSQADTHDAEYLHTQPIHLNRFTHMVMFALQLALGYCIATTLGQITPLVVSLAVALTILVGVVYHLIAKRFSLALGELGKIALPTCVALLFALLSRSALVDNAVTAVAVCFFLILEIMNVSWLVRTASIYHLDAIRHLASGRLPLVSGLVCGLAIGLVVRLCGEYLELSAGLSAIGLIASGVIAVFLVAAYTLLPFNQGTPVREGIIHNELTNLTKPEKATRQGKPFRDVCNEFGRVHGLTTREREVLFLLACGYNAETIADILIVSSSTARTHVYRIYQKTGIHSQQELIRTLDTKAAQKG